MYVIAIGWLYVTVLMAATEENLTAGVLTFVLYGLAPLALLLWLFGTPQRRRQRGSADRRPADGVEAGSGWMQGGGRRQGPSLGKSDNAADAGSDLNPKGRD